MTNSEDNSQYTKSQIEESDLKDTQKNCQSVNKWRKICVLAALVYANFWMSVAYSVQAPFFPQEAESKGATPTQYGLIFGSYEIAIIVFSPVFGKLLARISPKCLIMFGVFLAGVTCTTFGLLDKLPSGAVYIASAFIVRILEGCGVAAFVTASFTIVASEFPDSVGTSFSIVETAFGVGLIIGPTIGGALYQVGGFMLPFVVNGGFLLFGCLILIFLLPMIGETKKSKNSGEFLKFILDGGIFNCLLAMFTATVFLGFNAATLEPHLRQFQLKPVFIGLVFVVSGTMHAITTPIWGKLCDKGVNPLLIVMGGYILVSIGVLLIGPVPFIPFKENLATIIACLVVIGIGISAKFVSTFIGALKNALARGFPDNSATHGMVSSIFTTCASIGAFIGPSLGGYLLENVGYKTESMIVFFLELISLSLLIVYLILKRKSSSKQQQQQQESDPLLAEKA